MKNNPVRKTEKGYYYDTKSNKRISKKEVERRKKISRSKRKKHDKEKTRREKISKSLKKYWEEKKEFEETEKILQEMEEEFDITEDEKMVWYHEQ